jgi:hypothetical protein
MARFDFAFFQLLFRILGRQTGDISRVDYKPQKPHYENFPEEQPFPRATPESQGVSSAYTAEFLQKLKDDPQANPHHVILMRHGKIIAECGYAPYPRDMWHITHSMCKSVTGMAIGLLIEDGKLTLDEKLSDIFSEYVGLIGIFRQSITVENLLDMTSRCEFGEAGAISGNDWRRGFMKAGCKGEPGGAFEYNSMNSYMLSAIVTKKTGMPMFEFLKERLFKPLGITEVFWESCPKGITKGGWGMFLRPEDAAKLGQLYLQKGKWNGVQVIPESWVETSTTKHIDNGEGNFGYGYQVWMSDRPGSFAYNGMLGQDVIVYPDTDMVIVINAGNKEMTQEGNLTDIIRGYFGAGYEPSEEALPEDTAGALELRSTVRRLEGKEVHLPCIVRGGWGERRSAYRPEVGEADLISMLIQSYNDLIKSMGSDKAMETVKRNFELAIDAKYLTTYGMVTLANDYMAKNIKNTDTAKGFKDTLIEDRRTERINRDKSFYDAEGKSIIDSIQISKDQYKVYDDMFAKLGDARTAAMIAFGSDTKPYNTLVDMLKARFSEMGEKLKMNKGFSFEKMLGMSAEERAKLPDDIQKLYKDIEDANTNNLSQLRSQFVNAISNTDDEDIKIAINENLRKSILGGLNDLMKGASADDIKKAADAINKTYDERIGELKLDKIKKRLNYEDL